MGSLLNKFRRETTNASKTASQTFNAPGVFYPPYGKMHLLISGRGATGNPGTPGNVTGTNPPTPSNVAGYNPPTPGNVSYNPPSGATVAGYNPSIPGNYAGQNTSGGNYAGNNPSTPGNVSGSNPSYSVEGVYITYSPNDGSPGTSSYYTEPGNGGVYNAGNEAGGNNGIYVTYQTSLISTTPGNPTYNPSTPGNPTYNPVTPGNPYYNPSTGGNAYYNSGNPGTAYNNPPTPGTAYYNPSGSNPNYNAGTPGNPGISSTVLGVSFPGGAGGALAPVVGPSFTQVPYSASGVAISVPPGGYVTLQEQW